VAKFPSVETITQCEIDDRVIEVSKKYLPFMASGFDSPKLTLHVGDGFEFMGKHQNEFDVIITDSSDPVGPAESLFQENYYHLLSSALRPGGIVCSQGENMWYHQNLISGMMKFCSGIFPSVGYAYTSIPTYPGGQIGLLLCSKDPTTKFEKPLRTFTDQELDKMNLRYYSSEMHTAAFILPRFAQKAIRVPLDNGTATDSKHT
jgi:spermidine synthase